MKQYLETIPYRKDNVYFGMALDEVLFESTQETSGGYIRLSSFSKESVTFGYFQKYKKESQLRCEDVTRRLTGGGLVEHNNDLILSLSFKYNNLRNVSFYYEIIHIAIVSALKVAGYTSNIYKNNTKSSSSKESLCFTNPVQYDIMIDNKKIVGGAMSRKKGAFLYQGSLQFVNLTNSKLIEKFQNLLFSYLAEELNLGIIEMKDNSKVIEKADMLSFQKYQNYDWIRKYR